MKIARMNEKGVLISQLEKPNSWVSILRSAFPDAIEIVPSYHEILLIFKDRIHSIDEMENKLRPVFLEKTIEEKPAHLVIPICFDKEFALDMNRVDDMYKGGYFDLINHIFHTVFTVEFLGFLPGFPYMSGLGKISIPRLGSPRNQVPKGSFAIAENQIGIYPMASPGGWTILGNCPLDLFDASREEPTIFLPGDTVRFSDITKEEHSAIRNGEITRKHFV